ncbi:STAS domain-containing protein [Polaromonas glacialis]|uniref:STAS domain-containing protein n=1 Tax=Polaromonas glacialis TaxID=866564 RepID=UPI000494EE81|nr:STAS domain-containing protein [Polaromonas glacialis]
MLKLPAVLTHAVASGFYDTVAREVLSMPGEVVVDASALSQFDSSALAIVLECRRQALAAGKRFSVQGASDQLLQLADVYGVAALIPASPPQAAAVAA